MITKNYPANKGTLLITFCLLIVIAATFSACGKKDDSPEQQIQRFVAAAENGAEQRDLSSIKKLISDNYVDTRKRTKRDIVRITAGYFLRHMSIHLLTRIGELSFPEENKAHLQLFVAMAGSPLANAEALLNLRADLYRFDMVLVRDNGKDWQLSDIAWRQAIKEDFFAE